MIDTTLEEQAIWNALSYNPIKELNSLLSEYENLTNDPEGGGEYLIEVDNLAAKIHNLSYKCQKKVNIPTPVNFNINEYMALSTEAKEYYYDHGDSKYVIDGVYIR